MNAVQVNTWSARSLERSEQLSCPCGQPVDDRTTTHCPRCGVVLHREG